MKIEINEFRDRLSTVFANLLESDNSRTEFLLPEKLTTGKAYEAQILALICEELTHREGCELTLVDSKKLVLKSAPGPINKDYPWIEVRRNGKLIGGLFTDIEFLSMSYCYSNRNKPSRGDYHELDIIMVSPEVLESNQPFRPRHDQILIGIECKNTTYEKKLLREVLGVRREMGLLKKSIATSFRSWPAIEVPCNPPSCLLVYTRSPRVYDYSEAGSFYGIQFHFEKSDID